MHEPQQSETDTTHTQDSARLQVNCIWTIKEKQHNQETGEDHWVVVREQQNTFTQTGLTALASAIQGGYVAPNHLVLETNHATLSFAVAIGATTITVNQRVDQAGDVQLVLSPGLSVQETVPFLSYSGTGPYTYTLNSATTHTHNSGDPVVRQVSATDTMSSVLGEAQYDATNDPGNRLGSAAGYSGGVGNWIMQFYLSATQAQSFIAAVGLSDGLAVSGGNLHNHVILGYDHTGGANDLEIDANLTLTN